ncbi:MAG: hypothetical protein ACXVDN_22305 [Ktedonobacteraceae bacterium]
MPLPQPTQSLRYGNLSEGNALDGCPDDDQAAHLHGEHINLVNSLPHEASEALDGVSKSHCNDSPTS